jgi:hypothetical protein
MLKKSNLLFILFSCSLNSFAQGLPDSSAVRQVENSVDDPSQFITRMELFNELQHHKDDQADFYLNQTTFRTVIKIGNRFTTRVDVPYVYNNFAPESGYRKSGFGDVSFRVLGYKFFQSAKSALTASIECSLNTAQSPLLGTGKNIIIPMVTYTKMFAKQKMLLAFTFQQANSFSGDEARQKISFTKVQAIVIKYWSAKAWTVVSPEWYFDYVNNGVSMNVRVRMAFAPAKRINLWIQPGAGMFGDFAARYQWNTEAGCRYFFLRNTIFKRKNSG